MNTTYGFEENKHIAGLENEKPIYDSSDGPVAKGGRGKGPGARTKQDVFVSGESFGGRNKAF